MNRRRAVVVTLLALLVTLAPVAIANSHSQLGVASNHNTDTDFGNADELTDLSIQGSGQAAFVNFVPGDEYNIVAEDGDGDDETSFNVVGDQADNTVAEAEFQLEPTFTGDIQEIVLNITRVDGKDYGATVDVRMIQEQPDGVYQEGTIVNSSWDPDYSLGLQTIEFDTEFSVDAGTDYTIEFVTDSSDNNGAADRIAVSADADSGLTGWASFQGTTFDRGANITFVENATSDRGIYRQNHTVEDAQQAKVNLSLTNAAAEVTVTDPVSQSQLGSGTFTTTGNHSISLSGQTSTKVQTNVTFLNQTGTTTAELHDESVLFTARAPTVDNASASPTGDLSTDTPTLEIQVNDSDFPLAQGDSVTAEFFVDGTSEGTDTLTSNGTAGVTTSSLTGGSHTWTVTVSDSYGLSHTSQDFTINVPSSISIREETPPHDLIDHKTAEVTCFEDVDTSPNIVNRTTSTGQFDLAGFPTGTEFSCSVFVPEYHNRTIILDSLFVQQDVFLINKSGPTAIENRFVVSDQSGNFPPQSTELTIQAPINQSLYGSGGYAWLTGAGDDLGADEAFVTDLIEGDRYRIRAQNEDGDTRILGAYTAETSGTINLNVAQVDISPTTPNGTAVSANWTNSSTPSTQPTVTVEYNDSSDNTSEVFVHIYERNNASNELLSNTSFTGDFGVFSTVETVPKGENDTTWVVEVTGVKPGENIRLVRPVGPGSPVLTDLPAWIVTVLFVGLILGITGLFSQVNGHIGGLVVAGVGGMFYIVGLTPGYLGGGVVLLAMLIAGALFIRESRSGGL